MFVSLSKPNYFIVSTLELINLPVWESREYNRKRGKTKKREFVLEDRVFTVSSKCGMKSRSEK